MPKRYLRDSDGCEEPSYFSDDPIDLKATEPKGFKAKINKALMVFVLLGTASLFVGNTLAANINLGGQRFEFGQGVTGLKACSSTNSLTVSQTSEYTNDGFELKTVRLSGIPTSCYGYNLILSVLTPGAQGSSTLATLFSTVKKLIILNRYGTFYTSAADASYVTLTSSNDAATSTDSVVISFNNPSLLTSDVGTIGIESSENVLTGLSCGAGGDCAVGGVGPGGGAVVLFTSQPFTAAGSPCNTQCRGLEMDKNITSITIDQWTKNAAGGITTGSVGIGARGLGAGYANTKLAMESANGSRNSTGRLGAMAFCWNKTTTSATDRWYLPSVMEYAYIFKQVSENAAFRTAFPGFPAVTDYYTSEEAWSSWFTEYPAFFTNGGPPAGITLLPQNVSPGTTRALAVQPKKADGTMVDSTYSGFAKLSIFDHAKSSGYSVMCMRAFN